MKRLFRLLYGVKADKWLHMLCGLCVAQAAFALLALSTMPLWAVASLSLAAAVVAGAAKEAVDVRLGVSSWADFGFTAAGGLVGVSLAILIAL